MPVTMSQACGRSLFLSLLILAECTRSIKCWQGRPRRRSSLFSPMQRAFLPLSTNIAVARRVSRLLLSSSSSHNGEKEPSHERKSKIRSGLSNMVSKIKKPTYASELERLEKENHRLREALEEAQYENGRLRYETYNRIVLETFEGERKLRRAENEIDDDASMTMSGEEMLTDESLWCDELEDGACPIEPSISFGEALRDRAYWLVGLLALQSCSGIILARNEALLANHPVSKWIQCSTSVQVISNA